MDGAFGAPPPLRQSCAVLRGGVCFISPPLRPSPPDKGLRVGAGPAKLRAAITVCAASRPPRAGGWGGDKFSRLIILRPHAAMRDWGSLCPAAPGPSSPPLPTRARPCLLPLFFPSCCFPVSSLASICLGFTIPRFFLPSLSAPPHSGPGAEGLLQQPLLLGRPTPLRTRAWATGGPGCSGSRGCPWGCGCRDFGPQTPAWRWLFSEAGSGQATLQGVGRGRGRSPPTLQLTALPSGPGILMFPPGFLKAWPGSVGGRGDPGTVHSHNCPANGHVVVTSLFKWKEGSTERASDLHQVAHLREPGCMTQSPSHVWALSCDSQ